MTIESPSSQNPENQTEFIQAHERLRRAQELFYWANFQYARSPWPNQLDLAAETGGIISVAFEHTATSLLNAEEYGEEEKLRYLAVIFVGTEEERYEAFSEITPGAPFEENELTVNDAIEGFDQILEESPLEEAVARICRMFNKNMDRDFEILQNAVDQTTRGKVVHALAKMKPVAIEVGKLSFAAMLGGVVS